MKEKIIVFLFLVMLIQLANAQAVSTERYAIVPAGGEMENAVNGIHLSWTLGQLVTLTLENSDSTVILTQGFQQPDIDYTTTNSETSPFDGDIKIFPNPTNGLINIEVQLKQKYEFSLYLFDVSGKMLEQSMHSLKEGLIVVDVGSYSKGQYFIEFINRKEQKQQTFKILKN